jgi:hypothetical protein
MDLASPFAGGSRSGGFAQRRQAAVGDDLDSV